MKLNIKDLEKCIIDVHTKTSCDVVKVYCSETLEEYIKNNLSNLHPIEVIIHGVKPTTYDLIAEYGTVYVVPENKEGKIYYV